MSPVTLRQLGNPHLRMLVCACRGLDPDCFEVPIEDGARRVAFERAYCYELYHRMRVRGRVLGELPKGQNNLLRARIGNVTPDFLIFRDGQHHLAVEVKPARKVKATSTDHGVEPSFFKDLRTLWRLTQLNDGHNPLYACGVLLVFDRQRRGHGFPRLMELNEWLEAHPHNGRLKVLWHRTPTEVLILCNGIFENIVGDCPPLPHLAQIALDM